MSQVYPETFTNGTGMENERRRVAVIGGGLVGCVAALQLAKKGYQVDLYESRSDIRSAKVVSGRSINLALSARGRRALAEVQLEEKILSYALPMEGRMLHSLTGATRVVPYDRNSKQVKNWNSNCSTLSLCDLSFSSLFFAGAAYSCCYSCGCWPTQCIWSVSRRQLNEELLSGNEAVSVRDFSTPELFAVVLLLICGLMILMLLLLLLLCSHGPVSEYQVALQP